MNPCEETLKCLWHEMVSQQLSGRGIKNEKVLDVFRRVPRHSFIDPALRKDAYKDFPLPIGNNQTISQPYIVALMVESLGIKKSDKVLEIGTGSGYETAILAELAKTVFSIERIENLALKAKETLKDLGYKNINIKIDDGTLGWNEHAPFDKIIVTASSPSVPEELLNQLSEEGKMVIPTGLRFAQKLILLKKTAKKPTSRESLCDCVFVPLIGKYGWEENSARKDI